MSGVCILHYCYFCRHYHSDWPCGSGTATGKSYGQNTVPRGVNLNQTTISITLKYEPERKD